jgi:YVTN family beta-propeller protein
MRVLLLLLPAMGPSLAMHPQVARTATPPAIASGLLSSRAIAFNPASGKVYAVDSQHAAVIVIDGKTHASLQVPVGAGPVSLAINSRTNKVYVANNGAGSVSVLDGETDAVLTTLDVGRLPYVLAVDGVANRVYVSNTFSGAIRVIDGATNTIHVLQAGSADRIAIDAEHHAIYLLGYEGGQITVIDGQTEAIRRLPAGDLHLWDLSLEPDTGVAYVARIGRGDVIVLHRDGSVGLPVKTGRMPCATALDTVRRLLYVANYEDDTVTVINPAQGRAIATIPVGPHPQAIVADPQANLIYVANMHGDSISVIDGAQKKVVATLNAGHHPYALTVDTQNGTVYAADFDADAVTAVDVRDLRENAMRRKVHL